VYKNSCACLSIAFFWQVRASQEFFIITIKIFFPNMKLDVLYEDNHVIAVYKPAGMLVQGNHSGDPTLMDEVKYFLKQKYNKPGQVFLGMVHRLDRPVCGIVLFAKTSKGASRISAQLRNHTIQKEYHALVEGSVLQSSSTLINYIQKNIEKNRVSIYNTSVPGSLYAELSYDVVERYPNTTLVKIQLKTGRPHQIRAQFSHIGHPIVGDVKYGAKQKQEITSYGNVHTTLCLCATSLRFKLATKDEWVSCRTEIPMEWKYI
jgi:23S rRNA pseudouridine1911/1915/1917 synthase